MPFTVTTIALALSVALSGPPAQAKITEPVMQTMPKIETVRDQLESYFADAPIMVAIAGCESHYRQFDSKGNIIRGEQNTHDVGIMQINEDYHNDMAKSMGVDFHTLSGNLTYARYLYEHEGTAPWVSSSYCWSQTSAAKKLARSTK